MITAALFMVTSADIIWKRYLFLGVDISGKTSLLVTGRASVARRYTFIGLEYESVGAVHKLSKIRFALSAFSAFLEAENANSAENAGVRSNFTINAMTDFLKVNPGETPDKILEGAFWHRVVSGDFNSLFGGEFIGQSRHHGTLQLR